MATGPSERLWQDTSLPADKRVDFLLSAMTLQEKVAQPLGGERHGRRHRDRCRG